MKVEPTVVVDRRDQEPFVFRNLAAEPGTLDTGDYSVRGLGTPHCSRTQKPLDLLACVGCERDRFKRELLGLRAYRFRLLIVECDASTLDQGNWRSELKPSHVLGSMAAWTAQYGLPIWLAGNHEAAAAFVERFLYQ